MLGNTINLAGIVLLFFAHILLSLSDKRDRLAYAISGTGAVIVGIGSYLLTSYPIVILNAFWAILSFSRAILGAREIPQIAQFFTASRIADWCRHLSPQWSLSLIMIITGALSIVLGPDDVAYIGSALYVLSYFALTAHMIKKSSYLIAGLLGYGMLVPHLVEVASWAVLINETLGAMIAAVGLMRLWWATRTSSTPA